MTLSPSRLPSPLAAFAVLAVAGLALAAPARSAGVEPHVTYPAKVTTMQGRIFLLDDLGHEFEEGSFLYYDGETEGRVQWRDLDRVTFISNLGHQPGSDAPETAGTRRAKLTFLDGSTRQVNLVVGRIHGHDELAERHVTPSQLAVIDFDEVHIAPRLYKSCLRGHIWEQEDYRVCPYDGLSLETTNLR